MCKIVTFTNARKLDIKKTAEKVGNILLETERDGFGYAVQGVEGVFGEKCIDSTFTSRIKSKNKVPSEIIKQKYESFGHYSNPMGGMILHGRVSTNDRGLNNCHPMIKKDHYLIHNGVVTDHGPEYQKLTTNDSEDVLHRFIEGVDQVQKHLTGYYAFAAFDPNNRLHVLRDRIATLYIGWCDKYDTYIIATTRDLVERVAKSILATVENVDEVKDDIYLIFNNNMIVSNNRIQSRGYGEREAKHASKSLGRSLDTTPYNGYEDYESYYDYDDDSYIYAEEKFQDAIKQVDDRCIIWDADNKEIDFMTFHSLSFKEQKKCYIETPEGDAFCFVDPAWKEGA